MKDTLTREDSSVNHLLRKLDQTFKSCSEGNPSEAASLALHLSQKAHGRTLACAWTPSLHPQNSFWALRTGWHCSHQASTGSVNGTEQEHPSVGRDRSTQPEGCRHQTQIWKEERVSGGLRVTSKCCLARVLCGDTATFQGFIITFWVFHKIPQIMKYFQQVLESAQAL